MDRARTIVALAMLTGCSGGGGGAVPPRIASPVASAAPASGTGSVTFSVKIPGGGTTSASLAGRRTPDFVSSATQGVLVQVYVDPQSANSTPSGTYAFDLSASSTACAPASGSGRTCTFALPLAAGTYDFVDTLYDAPPANGSFGSAKVLGVGRATQTIARYVVNTVAISIGGRVASIVLGPVRDVAVNTAPVSYALTITALDADGVTIVAGTADPYDNPITVTAGDTGGHTTLALDGGAPAASVTTSQSSDTIAVAYDGAAPAGYFATISATAAGTPSASAGFDSFSATPALVSFLGSGETQTETIVEPHNTGPFVVTPDPKCATITAAGPLSGTGSTETFVLASGTLAGTCYVTAASETGTASVPIKVVNLVPGIVTVPQHRLFTTVPSGANAAIRAYDVANGGALVQTISGAATTLVTPNGIARDSAGSIYVSDANTGTIDIFPSNASGDVGPASTLTVALTPGTATITSGVGVDRAGDVFALNLITFFNSPIDVFLAGSTTASNAGGSSCLSGSGLTFNYALAVDPSGETYVDDTCTTAVVSVYPFGATQAKKSITLPFASSAGSGIALDLAGDVYVSDPSANTFLEYGPTAFGAATPILTGTGLANPGAIAVANDGTVYVVTHPSSGGTTSTSIAVFPPGATTPASTFPISAANINPGLSL